MTLRKIYHCVMIILLFALQPAIADQGIDLDLLRDIPNVVFLQEDVIGGGVPSKEALKEIKRQGFKSVIDLRMKIEGTMFAKALVEKLEIKYFNIPIRASNISDEHMKQFDEIISDPDNKPALVHCAVGGRVQVLWQQYKKGKEDDPALE